MLRQTFKKKNIPNKETTSTLTSLFYDKSITNAYTTLETYLKEKNTPYDKTDLIKIRKDLEAQVFNAVDYVSHLIYYIQTISGEWGAAGEQQVKNNFLKIVLQMPSEETVTYENNILFEETLNKNYQKHGIHNIPVSTATTQLKNYKFTLLNRNYKFTDITEINRLLHFSGSKKFYFVGSAGTSLFYYIYGNATQKHIKEYSIITYTHEEIRSPNSINALAALTSGNIVVIRNYSLETIFHQKWIPAIESKQHSYFQANSFWNISQAIKEKCLEGYSVKNEEMLIEQKDTFIKDMRETIAYHELGHTIINHEFLSHEELAIGKSTENVKETIYASLLEFFADFAPKHKGFLGPIQNLCKISKHDINRAERMFYMYLSDVWFYDTPDEYMYIYSDLMLLILIKYIQPDQHIDFTNLEKDIPIKKDRPKKDNLTIMERLYELYILETQEIKVIAAQAKYTLSNELDYEKSSKLIKKIIREDLPLLPKESGKYAVVYWKAVINFILTLSDSKQRLINYLEDQEKSILRKILILACGRKKAEAYNYDHRKFICDRMIELGFTSK